jgi:hypothetical protein
MSQINAKGKINGLEVNAEVILEDGHPVIEIDGEYDEVVQARFNEMMNAAPSMGGTYYPQPNTLLAAFSVLQSAFFDESDPVVIEVVGDIGEIPYNPGVIY